MFFALEKKKYVWLIFQKLMQFVKNNNSLVIPDEEKEDCHYLAVAKIIQIILRNNVKIMVICIV